jgi:hypothetical protein
MVTSKAGGVAIGGAQGTANAGASEFSGANFTYVKITDGGTQDWTVTASTTTDGYLAHIAEWASQKGTIVAMNATAAAIFMIFEGPFGWGTGGEMQIEMRADDPSAVTTIGTAGVCTVTTALVLA